MNKKLLATALLGLGLFPSLLFGQYYRMDIDLQNPGENRVIDRVFTGNTVGLDVGLFDGDVPFSATNWTVWFKYGDGQYATNDMQAIAGVTSSNRVVFNAVSNVFYSPNENYYFSIFGTNGAGRRATFARGRLIEEYDPAASEGIGTSSNGIYYHAVSWETITGDPESNAGLVAFVESHAGAEPLWTAASNRVLYVGDIANVAYGTSTNEAYRGDWGAAVSNWGDWRGQGFTTTSAATNIAQNVASNYVPLYNGEFWSFIETGGARYLFSDDGFGFDFSNGDVTGAWNFTNGIVLGGVTRTDWPQGTILGATINEPHAVETNDGILVFTVTTDGSGFPLTNDVSADGFDLHGVGWFSAQNATISNNATVNNSFSVGENAQIGGTLAVHDDMTVYGNLAVIGYSSNIQWHYLNVYTQVNGGTFTNFITENRYSTNNVYLFTNIVNTTYTTQFVDYVSVVGSDVDYSLSENVMLPHLTDGIETNAVATGTWDFSGATVNGLIDAETDPLYSAWATTGPGATNAILADGTLVSIDGWGSGGSGANLNDLADVDTAPADGDVLAWNSSASVWTNAAAGISAATATGIVEAVVAGGDYALSLATFTESSNLVISATSRLWRATLGTNAVSNVIIDDAADTSLYYAIALQVDGSAAEWAWAMDGATMATNSGLPAVTSATNTYLLWKGEGQSVWSVE